MTGTRAIPGVLLLLLLLAASCNKKGLDALYSDQEKDIESIVESMMGNDSTVTVEHFGATTRVTVVHGDGTALPENGKVRFYYAGHYISSTTLNASNLFCTNNREYADKFKWSVSDTAAFEPVLVDLAAEEPVEGLGKGLPGVRPGDECYIMFSGKTAFGKGRTGIVPAHSALAYHIWVLEVENH